MTNGTSRPRVLLVDDDRAFWEDLALYLEADHELFFAPDPLAQRRDGRRSRGDLVHADPAMARLLDHLAAVAATDTTVLLTGESGTGKEMVARWIHERSGRADGPFWAVHCAALPENLIESELFGHVRGAFTGADRDHAGAFDLARGGTLLLDEIGEAPMAVQVKLLRVLENREYKRVGGERMLRTDVRLVCATRRDLRREVAAGRFRDDLFYRISVVQVELPPLRVRRGDIPRLAEHFVRLYAAQLGKPLVGLTEAALQDLAGRSWPGNVRELRNVIERAVIVARGDRVTLADLAVPSTLTAAADFPHYESLKQATQLEFDTGYMLELMIRARGNVIRASELSGLSRTSIYRLLDRTGLREKFETGYFKRRPVEGDACEEENDEGQGVAVS